jgi:hypothetical protein
MTEGNKKRNQNEVEEPRFQMNKFKLEKKNGNFLMFRKKWKFHSRERDYVQDFDRQVKSLEWRFKGIEKVGL